MRVARALLQKLVEELRGPAPDTAAMLEMILLTDKSLRPTISFLQPVRSTEILVMRDKMKKLLETPAQRRKRLKMLKGMMRET